MANQSEVVGVFCKTCRWTAQNEEAYQEHFLLSSKCALVRDMPNSAFKKKTNISLKKKGRLLDKKVESLKAAASESLEMDKNDNKKNNKKKNSK